jgi:hypothetical protein
MIEFAEIALGTFACFATALSVGHILFFRFLNHINNQKSRQVQFVKIAAFFLIIFQFLQIFFLKLGMLETVSIGLMSLLFSYFLFHFFNLSQTGRRIRLLIEIRQLGRVSSKIQSNLEEGIDLRLSRLQKMGQIQMKNGRYYLTSKTFLNIGKCLVLFKRIFFSKV